jgi:hypothetical protein
MYVNSLEFVDPIVEKGYRSEQGIFFSTFFVRFLLISGLLVLFVSAMDIWSWSVRDNFSPLYKLILELVCYVILLLCFIVGRTAHNYQPLFVLFFGFAGSIWAVGSVWSNSPLGSATSAANIIVFVFMGLFLFLPVLSPLPSILSFFDFVFVPRSSFPFFFCFSFEGPSFARVLLFPSFVLYSVVITVVYIIAAIVMKVGHSFLSLCFLLF